MNSALLDLLLPRYCIVCGRRLIENERRLCLHCLISLPRTRLWLNPQENVLAKSYWGRTGAVEIQKVAAFLSYGSATMVGKLVKQFKYYGNRELARDMGRLMAQELKTSGFFDNIDCIVPVPITLKRRWQRKYNQTEYLAKGIANETGLPVYNKVLTRTSFSASQTTRRTTIERIDNVAEAFSLNRKRMAEVEGKHILLVDDVITTVATTAACVSQLAEIPGVKVSVLGFSTVQSGNVRIEIDKK